MVVNRAAAKTVPHDTKGGTERPRFIVRRFEIGKVPGKAGGEGVD